jgi:hypothetical protein
LNKGASFPLIQIDEDKRKADLEFHINRRNHKSSITFQDALDLAISEDVSRGFTLPLPIDILSKLQNASIAPLRCNLSGHNRQTWQQIYKVPHDP